MTFDEAYNSEGDIKGLINVAHLKGGAPYYIEILGANGEDDCEWFDYDGCAYESVEEAIEVCERTAHVIDAGFKVVNSAGLKMWEN